MFSLYEDFMKPEIGDQVIVTTLLPGNFPVTGGFPYTRDDFATVVDIGVPSASLDGWRYAQYTVHWPPKCNHDFGPYKYAGHDLILVKKHDK